MKSITKAETIAISKIHVPEKYHRPRHKVEDDKLRQSIERTGIQQPLVVTEAPDQSYVLVDGYRRLEVAKYLGHTEVPCVVDEVPEGVSPENYRDRIRFILDEHRQDLLPSQRAALIGNLMTSFRMNRKQVAEYLGVDAATIGNWLEVGTYIPEVVRAIDANEITQHAARAFVGMTRKGQEEIWGKHHKDFREFSAGKLHRKLREQYHPKENPDFYTRPERVINKLNRSQVKRVSKKRPVITKDEKQMLAKDLELRELELKDSEKDLVRLKSEIAAATRIVRAVMQNERLLNLVPDEMKPDLERFAEIYL